MRTTRLIAALSALAGLCTLTVPAGAQLIIVGEGYEAFPGVRYQGGDARFPDKLTGVFVLTDSTLAYYPCRQRHQGGCVVFRDKTVWEGDPYFVVPLTALLDVQQSSRVRGPTTGAKFMIGALASDRTEEFIGLEFETATSAEAPVFATFPTQAGAIDAKIRFRLRRLGKPLPEH